MYNVRHIPTHAALHNFYEIHENIRLSYLFCFFFLRMHIVTVFLVVFVMHFWMFSCLVFSCTDCCLSPNSFSSWSFANSSSCEPRIDIQNPKSINCLHLLLLLFSTFVQPALECFSCLTIHCCNRFCSLNGFSFSSLSRLMFLPLCE